MKKSASAGLFSKESVRVKRRRVGVRDEAFAAAGLVFIARTDLDEGFGFDGSLRIVGRRSAFYADGVGFCDEFRDGQELRHRLDCAARIILIEGRADDAGFVFSKQI